MAHPRAAYLFVPGNHPERFAKACQAAPGMTIIDLEDAVPPEQKDAARDAAPPRNGRSASGRSRRDAR